MGKLLDSKIKVDKIEVPIDTDNESGAKSLINAWGPTIPVIKINGYVLGLGDVESYQINIKMNNIPSFILTVNDSKFKIRKALNKEKIDTAVIFIGNAEWYHKYNGLITNCISDAGDEKITITGIIYNPKLYNTIQKAYNDLSLTDIIKDICSMTDMGLFTFDNNSLANILTNCLNPGKRYIDFFVELITKYTNNLWCFDTFYYLHVGDIETIRNSPIDTYTMRNGKKFDSPQPIKLITGTVYENIDYNTEIETKLHVNYYTINTNIGNSHINHYNKYELHDSVDNIKSLSVSDDIGIGNLTTNTFSRFSDKNFPFYQSRVNKEIAGKSINLEMADILYEIAPFQVIDLEVYVSAEDKNTIIIDTENSGKKIIIGYNFYFDKTTENQKSNIRQSIEVI